MEPRIVEKDGRFFIEFAGKVVEISDSEAEALQARPDAIYDVIVSHTRKFNFKDMIVHLLTYLLDH